jgi:PEP-CTERM motif
VSVRLASLSCGMWVGLAMLAVAETASAAGVTVPLSDFVIFSGGGVTFSSGDETSIGGHTLVNGNIGSDQDVFMQGNPVLNYPAQLNGSAYAGGNLTFGQDLTVGSPAGPLREVVVNGSANIGGGANIYGNLYGDAVTLGQNSGIRKAGGVGGNVEYTSSYSPSNATVEGSASSPSTKTFNLISMPAATAFTAGGANETVPAGSGSSLTLAPGTYGTLATSAQNQTVNLSSGNYYFDAVTAQGGFTLKIDLTSGNPINLYLVGNATFAQQNTLMVKGTGTGGAFVPISQASQLAGLIYLETHGRFIMGGATDGNHNIWGGTVYASLLETASAEVSIGQYMDWYGKIYALDSIDIADHGIYNVPEPSTLALLGLGGLAIALGRRRSRIFVRR